ncbi:hypothetical protein RUM44_004275 [Polyplax serrata]|uniref:Scavenger receptor class B member 1 n=1 Tax=Polyplax serrata TaxID=468196 RepID=A0ABR1B2D0_POLSC
MWATDIFTQLIHQNLIISNNSMRYEAWKAPPVHAFLRIYIFNYTNVMEFEKGIDSKLKIQELGPYTYTEKWERVDVKFNENGTATYRDRKIYRFSPEHSRGQESDIVVVPNLPFLSALSLITDAPSLVQWSITTLMRFTLAEPFISLNISDFLWGYEDRFSVVAQHLLSMRYDLPFKKFGIMSAKNGTQRDFVTIYTGEDDPSKTGIVVSYDGKTSLNYWNSAECNRIDGTDGTIYPPALVHPNSTLYVYSKDLCRKMPLTYNDEYLDKHGIHVMKFRIPESVFASGHVQKENLCFCNHAGRDVKCLPSGIFNVGPCVFGEEKALIIAYLVLFIIKGVKLIIDCTTEAPLVTSLPHFLYGDAILSKGVEGLDPVADKHESFVEVDPKMGIPVGGKSRLQLNIMLNGEYGTDWRNVIYKDQKVFPVTWMDYGIDKLPDDVSATIRSILIFIKVAQFSFSYGFIICSIVFGILFIHGCCQSLRGNRYIIRRGRDRKETQSETPLFVISGKR